MFLETCLTVLNVAEKATKLFDWFTGISSGERMNATIKNISSSNSKLERLSDKVLYAPDLHQAINIEGSMSLNNKKEIYDLVNPIAEALETDILTSAVVFTPEKLRNAFKKDPWELLIDVRPVNRTKRPTNPDLVPISFRDGNLHYIGWQTRGALPSLFNCDFEYDGNLYLPTKGVNQVVKANERTLSKNTKSNIKFNESIYNVQKEEIKEKFNIMMFDGLEYLIKEPIKGSTYETMQLDS